jgi:DNA-binding IclR family transcriptional regulator
VLIKSDELESKAKSKRVQSIEVGFAILKSLADNKSPMSLNELAKTTGLHKSQLYRYINSFVHLGVLLRDQGEHPKWSLGPELIALGSAAFQSFDLANQAKPHLVKLRNRLNETVALSIWRERGAFFVQYEKSQKFANIDFDIGSYVPLYTATGKVFRAFLPQEETAELYWQEVGTGNIEPLSYADEVERVKKSGIAASENNLRSGIAALSVPVFYHSGELAAVVSVVGFHGMLDMSPESEPAVELLETAKEISRKLGFTGSYPYHDKEE